MKRRRCFSLLLALVIVFGLPPVSALADGSETTAWTQLQAALAEGGKVTLTNDVIAAASDTALTVPKGKKVTLDLNGFTIDRGLTAAKKKGCVIEVLGELIVTDESDTQTGAIKGGYTDGTGGGVWVRGGCFTLENGAITGNSAKNVGGGVYLSGSDAKFYMYGGSITGNSAKNGGGIGMDGSGVAEFSGGTISNNTADNNGGGVWFGKGTSFTFAQGSIIGNTAANQGGGIYINDGAFEYTGGNAANNQQAVGGDIAAKSGSYLPTFPVTVNYGENGIVTADKETAAAGETVTLTGEPNNDGYQLKSLTVTAGGAVIPTTPEADGTYSFTMPAAAVTVSAEFRELHSISTLVSLYNDQYNTETDCTLTADKEYAIEGETVTLTLDLKPGYEYLESDVNYDTQAITQVDDTTFTFVMPDENAVAAVYIKKAQYTVSLGGAVDRGVTFLLNNELRDTAPFPAEYGDWVAVLFEPEGQMISAMTYTYVNNGKTVTNTLRFNENDFPVEGSFRMPNSDVTVRVEFSGVYNVNEDWAHVENGVISAEVAKAAAGSYVTVYAVADERYTFNRWNFTPDVMFDSNTTAADGTRIAKFVMPEQDVSFYAEFKQTIYDVTAELPDGHGTITGDDWGRAGEDCSFTVTPDSGYAVKSVTASSGGEALPLSQTDGVYTFTMPYANVTLTAEFKQGGTWTDLASLLLEGDKLEGDKIKIVLADDYTAAGEDDSLSIPEGISVILDLNGHTVDGRALPGSVRDVLIIEGALELGDSAGGGSIIGEGGDDVVYVKSGSFLMTGGTLKGMGNSWAVCTLGAFKLCGGSVICDPGDIAVAGDSIILDWPDANDSIQLGPVDVAQIALLEALTDGTNIYSAGDYTSAIFNVTIAGEVLTPAPGFKSHQLILSGQIGMHFNMRIPEGMTDGTMTFTVGKRTATAAGELQSDGLYKFTCYINSVEMAEEITATYTFTAGGETKIVTNATSVKEYLEAIINNEKGLAEYTAATPLAKAIYNYGHYAMQAVPGGKKHPEMPGTYTGDVTLLTSLEGYAISATLDKNVITAASYSLDLDSETAINFYLTTESELTKDNVSVTASDADFEYTVEKVGSRYRVQITGIGAHELGTVFTLTTGGTTISASAMTYVQQHLANANASTATKNAAAALYAYYKEAIDYRNDNN